MFVALTLAVSGLALSLAPGDVDAKRLGSGKPAGMQRQAPPQQAGTPPATAAPQNNAAPVAGAAAPAAAGTAAAAGKRSWMGPIAGLAAGLGIAALLSHFGMGEGLANFMTMLLMAAAAFFVIRWLLRRFGPQAGKNGNLQMVGAGAGKGAATSPWSAPQQPMQRSAVEPTPGAAPAATGAAPVDRAMPEGFDADDFARTAKMIFVRMQAANDSGQVDDLRKFTTPELFASLRVDLQDRGNVAQQTDVLQLDAKVVDTVQEDGQWIVTVRFSGLIRERSDAGGEPFRELWHLVKPVDGSREWAIAGITPEA